MALQDLTPQLRTRLGRVERIVGLFVTIATLLLLAGLAYYIYHTGKRHGWFVTKAPYFTYVDSAAGLNVGEPVKLMGFNVGEITKITAEDPGKQYDVYVEFNIRAPYYGYLWNDSRVKVTSTDLLGNRSLEVTKGGTSGKTNNLHATYHEKDKNLTEIWLEHEGVYTNFTKTTKPYWLMADESPAVTKRMEKLADQIEKALPNIWDFTNKLSGVLTNVSGAASQFNSILVQTRPALTNLTLISENIRDPHGSLGEWLIPTNLHRQLEHTLKSADATVSSADTNLNLTISNLNRSLDNLANLTSNLNSQVQINTNILSEISAAIIHSDELMQGLKRHWLLRSAFKTKTTKPIYPKSPAPKSRK
ncbi:MAG: MlaD family protein, partial [Limisphaerales bacterium]